MHPLAQTFRLLLTLCAATTIACAAWGQGAQGQAGQGPGAAPPAETPQRRTALVIGNNGYDSSPLVNPINDARAMATVLREAGFTVLLHTDVDQRQFNAALREFGERLKLTGGTGLFYFAGHGVQIRGRNFLIPCAATSSTKTKWPTAHSMRRR